jgi:hypothetical protein
MRRAGLWYANVTTGATATIQVTSSGGIPEYAGIAVGTIDTSTLTPNSAAASATFNAGTLDCNIINTSNLRITRGNLNSSGTSSVSGSGGCVLGP